MTAKAVAQFDYDLVTDEPYKSILHVQAKQKLIKRFVRNLCRMNLFARVPDQ